MSPASTFRLKIQVPSEVKIGQNIAPREQAFVWIWNRFGASGLLGVHEGTLLSEQALELGLETESFTVDAGQAPRSRDWVGGRDSLDAELYFDTQKAAQAAGQEIAAQTDIEVLGVIEQPAQDWDAEWKASFKGVAVPPNWIILPPWEEPKPGSQETVLRINPGAGFGTGTHETTQLCLQFLGELKVCPPRVLDFGSGSGILAIGAALQGATEIDAVEIDPLANDNARENAKLNSLGDSSGKATIRICETMPEDGGPYGLIFANILRPVLLEFADTILARRTENAVVIVSGLVASDVAEVRTRYRSLLGGRASVVRELGEWRAIAWL